MNRIRQYNRVSLLRRGDKKTMACLGHPPLLSCFTVKEVMWINQWRGPRERKWCFWPTAREHLRAVTATSEFGSVSSHQSHLEMIAALPDKFITALWETRGQRYPAKPIFMTYRNYEINVYGLLILGVICYMTIIYSANPFFSRSDVYERFISISLLINPFPIYPKNTR